MRAAVRLIQLAYVSGKMNVPKKRSLIGGICAYSGEFLFLRIVQIPSCPFATILVESAV